MAFRGFGTLLGGVREVFWRPSGGSLEAFGKCFGHLGGILGAWSPKKPSSIPKGGVKTSPRRFQEAPRVPQEAPRSTKRHQMAPKSTKKHQKAPKGTKRLQKAAKNHEIQKINT